MSEMATHRHKKRGTEYVLIGFGRMQAEHWIAKLPDPNGGVGGVAYPVDGQEVAIYRGIADGHLYVRPRSEFEDGRFAALSPAAPEKG